MQLRIVAPAECGLIDAAVHPRRRACTDTTRTQLIADEVFAEVPNGGRERAGEGVPGEVKVREHRRVAELEGGGPEEGIDGEVKGGRAEKVLRLGGRRPTREVDGDEEDDGSSTREKLARAVAVQHWKGRPADMDQRGHIRGRAVWRRERGTEEKRRGRRRYF